MRIILSLFLVTIVFFSCEENIEPQQSCDIKATVKDMTGFDGCGYILITDSGIRLEPVIPFLYCGTPPLPPEVTNDPLWQWEFYDGQRVSISYEEIEMASICMVGQTVKITCISELTKYSPSTQN